MFDFFAVSGPNLLCLNRITWFLAIALILSSWDHSSDLDRLWPLSSSSSSSSSSSTSTSSSHSSSMMVDGFFLNRFERFKRITFPSALAGLSSFLPGFPSGVRVCINFSSFYPQGYQQNTCFLCDFYRFNSIIPSNINFTQANCIMNNCQPLTYGSRYPSIQSSQPQPQPPSSSFQNFKPIGSLFQHYQQQPINLQQHHHHHQNQQKQQQQQQQEKQQQHQQKR
ncbi:hypothetical protein SSS_00299 [Sarcoptes scabiei]|uniref:Uncharacterized protein n=1 Tax=Sarcoptes scabiei TaxID=52283 RepID=A0A834RG18_SARSC|nr:hypothetical protein SSS_00299 [Sarcoptes scabiei]